MFWEAEPMSVARRGLRGCEVCPHDQRRHLEGLWCQSFPGVAALPVPGTLLGVLGLAPERALLPGAQRFGGIEDPPRMTEVIGIGLLLQETVVFFLWNWLEFHLSFLQTKERGHRGQHNGSAS